jgi:hypothetical protein
LNKQHDKGKTIYVPPPREREAGQHLSLMKKVRQLTLFQVNRLYIMMKNMPNRLEVG